MLEYELLEVHKHYEMLQTYDESRHKKLWVSEKPSRIYLTFVSCGKITTTQPGMVKSRLLINQLHRVMVMFSIFYTM